MGDEVAHSFEERPWGSWHVLDEGEGYKVKRLEVKPGKRLSYQTHSTAPSSGSSWRASRPA